MAGGFRDHWECASAVRSIWGKEYKRKKGVKLGRRSWERRAIERKAELNMVQEWAWATRKIWEFVREKANLTVKGSRDHWEELYEKDGEMRIEIEVRLWKEAWSKSRERVGRRVMRRSRGRSWLDYSFLERKKNKKPSIFLLERRIFMYACCDFLVCLHLLLYFSSSHEVLERWWFVWLWTCVIFLFFSLFLLIFIWGKVWM